MTRVISEIDRRIRERAQNSRERFAFGSNTKSLFFRFVLPLLGFLVMGGAIFASVI